MTIKDLIKYGKDELDANNIDESILKTRLLLEYVLNEKREYIMIHLDEEIGIDKESLFKSYIKRLVNNEPIQYIIKKQEFMGLEFLVNENVLIPRSDTEVLVENVINLVKNNYNNFINNENIENNENKEINILDMCTGTGAIIISLAKYLDKYNINFYASDVSKKAIEVAKENAINNNIEITFIESDLFSNINDIKFDVIVSNPPYIEKNVIKSLDENVKKEPILALDGGVDGLDFYRNISKDSKKYLNKNGYLCYEIGYNQKESVTKILRENGYIDIKCIKDYSNNDRVIVSRKG